MAARPAPRSSDLLPGEIGPFAPTPPRSPRKASIVAAARALLEIEGPEALTMRRLADAVGVRAPSLYKHFVSKAAVEMALIEDVLVEIGTAGHAALHQKAARRVDALSELLRTYREHALANPNLYRLATSGPLSREELPPGLEEWAGNPWYVATGDPALAQACWSFAHGMVVLELDGRYPPGSDLEATWRAGASAFRAEGPSA